LHIQANSGHKIWKVKFQTGQTAADGSIAAHLGVRMVDASIVVTSYNHGPYIAQCLTGILEQTTERRLEIVWYDDASTDDTVAIGEQILMNSKHEIIRLHNRNNRHERKIPGLLDEIEQCRGRYIFFLDGDDCWIVPNKVDLQIDALELNPDVSLCFTPAYVISGNNNKPLGVLCQHSNVEKIFTLDEVIVGDGGFMPTISLCIRSEIFTSAPNWIFEKLTVGDYPLQVVASAPSGALYLPDITCIYRQNVEGSWTTTVFNNDKKRLDFEADFIDLLVRLHNYYPGHSKSFAQLVYSHFSALLKLSIEQNEFMPLQRATLLLSKFN
jgi:glycosyltransferase involved in cell wall biosynthesis